MSSHGGSYSPKYRPLTQDSKQGLEPLGLGRSSSLLKLLPTLGFRSIVEITGWRKDSDGQEVAEDSMGPTCVCSSRIFSTLHFPPVLLGVSDNSSCES